MINFTRLSVRCGLVAISFSLAVVGQAGAAHADRLPFRDRRTVPSGARGARRGGEPHGQGGAGQPAPTGVEISSPALADGTVLGDTGRAWVGAGRVKETVEPGTYPVTFTLRHEEADCVTEENRDHVCDYPRSSCARR